MTAPVLSPRETLAAVLAAADLDDAREIARAALERLDAEPRRLVPLKTAMFELGLGERQTRRLVRDFEADGIAIWTGSRWIIDIAAAAGKRRRRS